MAGSDDFFGTVRIWEFENDRYTHLFNSQDPSVEFTSIVFSPDGAHLAVALSNRSIQIWSTARRPFSLQHDICFVGEIITDLAFSMDGRSLAMCGHSLGDEKMVKAQVLSVGPGLRTNTCSFAAQPEPGSTHIGGGSMFRAGLTGMARLSLCADKIVYMTDGRSHSELRIWDVEQRARLQCHNNTRGQNAMLPSRDSPVSLVEADTAAHAVGPALRP
jgi:WD40 repeat protein